MWVRIFFLSLFFVSFFTVSGQISSHAKRIAVSDTIFIDSLSLVKNEFKMMSFDSTLVDSSYYFIDFELAQITWKQKPQLDSVLVFYKTLPVKLAGIFFKYDKKLLLDFDPIANNPFILPNQKQVPSIFDLGGFEKSGSIARGIGVGNNQNLVVNSGFNLQLSGKLAPDIELNAAVTDNTVPFQPDGYTQQIQDFDRVFVQVKHPKHQISVGDFDLTRPNGYFLNYFKNVKGAKVDNVLLEDSTRNRKLTQSISLNAARGKFGRNTFIGIEGNQGPYRLTGDPGEAFIVVLAASERVFIDGELLKRGEEYDYVMDYNTSELRFMPRRMITNQSRIIVEFEYANQAYLRLLSTYQINYQTNSMKVYLNSYRDADAKNQPFQQDLTNEQKDFLSQLGNRVDQSFFPGAQQVLPEPRALLYRKTDSLGFAGVFVFDANQSAAELFRVQFSFVGQGQGDYQIARDVANGRVYEWVQPIVNLTDTVKRGDYSPVIKVTPPQILAMSNVGFDWQPTKNSNLLVEFATSNNNPNTFSEINNGLNRGYAGKLQAKHLFNLNNDSSASYKLAVSGGFELLDKRFRVIQPFRNMEFARDWGLANIYTLEEEQMANLGFNFLLPQNKEIGYNLQTLSIPALGYNGLKHGFSIKTKIKKAIFNGSGSFLDITQPTQNGGFDRVKLSMQIPLLSYTFGIGFEQERNKQVNPLADSLLLNSFDFHIFSAEFGANKNEDYRWTVKYNRREDRLPGGKDFRWQQTGHIFSIEQELAKNVNNQIKTTLSYRKLFVSSFFETINQPDQSLVAQIDYNFKWFNQFVLSNIFYQIGNGQELRRDFSFLEVAPGQGAYAWFDYNNDGVQQLNEFERAFFSDQARFIKIFIPGNTYVQTFNTQFSQTLQLQPERLIKGKSFTAKTFKRISTLTAFSIDKKSQNNSPLVFLNPFDLSLTDSALQSSQGQIRNTIFINRNSPKFGIDFSQQYNLGRILLSNGFETRQNTEQQIKSRYNLLKTLTIELLYTYGTKVLEADYFTQRNFIIESKDFEPRINWVLDQKLRLSFSFNLQSKLNSALILAENQFIAEGGEKLNGQKWAIDVNYNLARESYLKANFSLAQLNFTGEVQNSAAYEMLQGLQPGLNALWAVSFFKRLANNMQINLTYDGRKAGETKVVHVGRVQARVTF